MISTDTLQNLGLISHLNEEARGLIKFLKVEIRATTDAHNTLSAATSQIERPSRQNLSIRAGHLST